MSTFERKAKQREVELKLELEPNLPLIKVDVELMQQDLAKLVTNALNYTPKGGVICLRAKLSSKSVVLEVKDTGKGVTADKLPHLFKRFYRADESRNTESGGTGLGLAIAKSIVELHGGEISASSIEGQGMTISIFLDAY